MIKKIVNGYQLITRFNWGIAASLIVTNVYLYPRLPEFVPVQFDLFNPSNHLSNKLIIWVFPLLFFIFAFLLSNKRIDAIVLSSSLRNRVIKCFFLIAQLILWLLLLHAYAVLFWFI